MDINITMGECKIGRIALHKSIIGILLIAGVMLLFLVQKGGALEFDNLKSYDEEAKKVTIKNAFGLGENLVEHTLTANTCDPFGNCYAEIDVTLHERGILFEDVEFKNVNGDKINLSYSQFFISEKYTEERQEPVYKDICKEVILENGTSKNCYTKIAGYKNIPEEKERWVKYDINTIEKPGKYRIKLGGKITEKTDWIVTSKGKKLTELAWWDTNYGFKQAWNSTNATTEPFNHTIWGHLIDTKTLITAGNLRSDCADLEMVNASETTTLGFAFANLSSAVVGCNTPSTLVYTCVDTFKTGGVDNQFYSYYDKSTDDSYSNTLNQCSHTVIYSPFENDFENIADTTLQWTSAGSPIDGFVDSPRGQGKAINITLNPVKILDDPKLDVCNMTMSFWFKMPTPGDGSQFIAARHTWVGGTVDSWYVGFW